MSALETLRILAAGKRPVGGLLHSCRFEGFGAETYGEEAIIARFRVADFGLPDDVAAFESKSHAALFGQDAALFADVAEGGIARLWALGDTSAAVPEPGVSVIFDPDMAQARGDLFFAPADHPELTPAAAKRVETLGKSVAREDPHYRARAFAIRAFGDADRGAALLAVYRLGGVDAGAAGFACVAVGWRTEGLLVVPDRAGERAAAKAAWTPHVRA